MMRNRFWGKLAGSRSRMFSNLILLGVWGMVWFISWDIIPRGPLNLDVLEEPGASIFRLQEVGQSLFALCFRVGFLLGLFDSED
jgi:hypothetical protein